MEYNSRAIVEPLDDGFRQNRYDGGEKGFHCDEEETKEDRRVLVAPQTSQHREAHVGRRGVLMNVLQAKRRV